MFIKEDLEENEFQKLIKNKIIVLDDSDSLLIKDIKDNIEDDVLSQFTKSKNGLVIHVGDKTYKTTKDVSKKIEKLKGNSSKSTNDYSTYDKQKFFQLGQYMVFKLASSISGIGTVKTDPEKVNGKELADALSEVFSKDDENFKNISNLEEAMSVAALSKVLKESLKSKKEEILSAAKVIQSDLEENDNDFISFEKEISELNPTLYKQTKDSFQAEFERGVEEYKKEMESEGEKIKNPITGKMEDKSPIRQGYTALKNKSKDVAKGIENKIKGSKHTIFTDALRLGLMAVKGAFLLGKGLKKFFGMMKKNKSSLLKSVRKLKLSEIEKKLNNFINDFNKAKQEQQIPESSKNNLIDLLNEADEQEDKQKGEEITKKFIEFSGELIAYLYKNYADINDMTVGKTIQLGNIDEKGIITLEMSKGENLTAIQDKINLYKKTFPVFTKLYDKCVKNVKTWKNMKIKDILGSIKFDKIKEDYKGINNFLDSLELSNDSQQIIDNIKNALNKDVFMDLSNSSYYGMTFEKFFNEMNSYKQKVDSLNEIVNFEKNTKIENYEEIKEKVPVSFDAKKFEENNEENIFEDLDLKDILPNLSVENKKLMFTKKDAEEPIEVNKNSTEDLKEKIADENDFFNKWKEENGEKKKDVIEVLNELAPETENKDENIFGELKTTEILDKLSLENDKVMFKKDDESEAIEIDQKNADVLKEMLTKNEEEFNKWKEENKEKKKDIIEKLNNLVGKADAIEPPPEIAKGIENAAKEMIAVNDHIDDEDFGKKYEKTKKDMEAVDKAVTQWADKNEKVYEFWDEILKKIGHDKEVLPLMWSLASLLRMKDILGEAIRMKNRMRLLKELNEAEENQENNTANNTQTGNETENKTEEKPDPEIEKVKQLILSTDDILKKEKAEDFKSAYEKWISVIDKAVEHFKADEKFKEKIEKDLKNEDPFEKICKLYKIITTKEEEKSEGNEESKPDPRGDKNLGDQDSDGDDGMGDSFIRMSLHDYLMKALND